MATYTRVDNNGQSQLIRLEGPAAVTLVEAAPQNVQYVQAAPAEWQVTSDDEDSGQQQIAIAEGPALTAVQATPVGQPLAVALPPPNYTCYQEPPEPRGETRWLKYNEPTITKVIEQNFNTLKTSVKENNIHHQHNRTVIQNVNRNHFHTHRIIVKDNNYHHYLTNNLIRVNDIHHQKIEQVRGEGKTLSDYKQTQRVEPASCQRTAEVQQVVAVTQPAQVIAVAEPVQQVALTAAPQTITQSPQTVTLTAAPLTITGPSTRYIQQL